MGLEVATTITGLNAANPLSSDQKNQGDDHLRLIKAVLLADVMGLSTVHAGASKATPVDADEIPIVDSLALTTVKKLTWANLKATLNSSGVGFPTGTRLIFQQTSAPTGWTKDTTAALNDTALRIVTGTVGSGGSVAFTTAFASQAVTVSGTALTEAQLPPHSHGPSGATYFLGDNANSNGNGLWSGTGSTYNYPAIRMSLTAATGSGQTHTHSGTAINLAVKYNDVIICTKD